MHYCGDVLESVSIRSEKPACCCPGDDAKTPPAESLVAKLGALPAIGKDLLSSSGDSHISGKSCCTEKVLVLKLTTDQLRTSDQTVMVKWLLQPALPSAFITPKVTAVSSDLLKPVILFRTPPPGVPLYKLFQRYTYYG